MRSKGWCLGLCFAVALLAGCGTVQEHRARQFSAQFSGMPESEQAALLGGGLGEGWDDVSVYISLGTPEYATRVDERTVLWVYWGVRPSEKESGSGRVFLSRSEWRRKRGGEVLEQLSIFFVDGRVDSWNFSEVSRRDLSRQRSTPFGRIPEV